MVQRRRRRGFIILFGTRSMIGDDDDARPVNAVCPRCGQRADIVGKTYRTWFTVFVRFVAGDVDSIENAGPPPIDPWLR